MTHTRRLSASGLVILTALAALGTLVASPRAVLSQVPAQQPPPANAQMQMKPTSTGNFTGIVTRDTLGHVVVGAEIALPALNRAMPTNENGEFHFPGIAAGRYLVTVHAIGFAPFADSIVVEQGQTLDGDLTLTPAARLLDTLRTTAARTSLGSRSLEEFETRRKTIVAGAFITDSVLRANELTKMSSLIARLPGVHTIQGRGMAVYIASAVATTDGRPAFMSTSKPCFVTVYVDGVRKYQAGKAADDPPDFQSMRASDFAGVEYYASPSMAPSEFSATGSDCGVMLLWSRRDRLSRPS